MCRFALVIPFYIMVLCSAFGLNPVFAAESKGSPKQEQSAHKLLVGASYFHTLMDEINGAEEQIAVMMYACVIPKDLRDDHPVKQLVEALANAQKRGVLVRVILDREIRRDGSEDTINNRAAAFMGQLGLAVRRDEPDQRSHSKLIIVDGKRVVLGSANWTWSAFYRNREHSIWLADDSIATTCLRDFNAVWQGLE